ncbi:26073_t:CDS:2, partial [Gigaspora rosea]
TPNPTHKVLLTNYKYRHQQTRILAKRNSKKRRPPPAKRRNLQILPPTNNNTDKTNLQITTTD